MPSETFTGILTTDLLVLSKSSVFTGILLSTHTSATYRSYQEFSIGRELYTATHQLPASCLLDAPGWKKRPTRGHIEMVMVTGVALFRGEKARNFGTKYTERSI